jgi:hypothetical protein
MLPEIPLEQSVKNHNICEGGCRSARAAIFALRRWVFRPAQAMPVPAATEAQGGGAWACRLSFSARHAYEATAALRRAFYIATKVQKAPKQKPAKPAFY